MLGVITEVTVKLLPARKSPGYTGGFDSIQAAGDSVGAIISEGIIPGGLEMMDTYAIKASRPLPTQATPLTPKRYYCAR